MNNKQIKQFTFPCIWQWFCCYKFLKDGISIFFFKSVEIKEFLEVPMCRDRKSDIWEKLIMYMPIISFIWIEDIDISYVSRYYSNIIHGHYELISWGIYTGIRYPILSPKVKVLALNICLLDICPLLLWREYDVWVYIYRGQISSSRRKWYATALDMHHLLLRRQNDCGGIYPGGRYQCPRKFRIRYFVISLQM